MAGNVFEWCASVHAGIADIDVPIDGAHPPMVHGNMLYRGGCWARSSEALEIVHRGHVAPWSSDETVGFRVICRPRAGKHG